MEAARPPPAVPEILDRIIELIFLKLQLIELF